MKIRLDRHQFEKIVDFIAEHNRYFKGQRQQIIEAIIENAQNLSRSRSSSWISTMGFTLVKNNMPDNCIHIDITADLNVGGQTGFIDLSTLELLV